MGFCQRGNCTCDLRNALGKDFYKFAKQVDENAQPDMRDLNAEMVDSVSQMKVPTPGQMQWEQLGKEALASNFEPGSQTPMPISTDDGCRDGEESASNESLSDALGNADNNVKEQEGQEGAADQSGNVASTDEGKFGRIRRRRRLANMRRTLMDRLHRGNVP